VKLRKDDGTEYELRDLLWLGFFGAGFGFTFGLGFSGAMAVTGVLTFLIRGAP